MPLSLADVLSAQAGGGPVYEGGPDVNVTPGGVLAALGSTWPARMGQDIVQGAMAPGNAYRSTPENPVTTEQMVGPAANLAMLMVGAPGGSGGVGSGARSFSERMAEAQDIAFQRAQRGQATGDYGLGTAKRTAPEAAAGTPEYSSDRLMSSLRDTQAQLAEYKNPQKPLLAPGESPEDFSLFSGGNKKAGAALAGIRAYHGSPYDFEKFDISKIGTGEGFQKYGHGLYFAENPAVAESYKATGFQAPPLSNKIGGSADLAVPPGKMYEVNINAEPGQFLDWEKQLPQQSESVKQALAALGRTGNRGEDIYRSIRNEHSPRPGFTVNNPDPRASSAILSEAGIPGIRYLDQGSRVPGDAAKIIEKYGSREKALEIAQQRLQSAGMGDLAYWDKTVKQLQTPGTSNYVVFNPEIVDILKKYGLAGLTMGGVLSAAGQEPAPTQ